MRRVKGIKKQKDGERRVKEIRIKNCGGWGEGEKGRRGEGRYLIQMIEGKPTYILLIFQSRKEGSMCTTLNDPRNGHYTLPGKHQLTSPIQWTLHFAQ